MLSFILASDNSLGTLNYSFTNLSSEQTDQHIHMAPSGQAIKDIEVIGNLQNWLWDLAPGGIYKTKQEMLDALFADIFFVNIHTANHSHGEISAMLKYDDTITPPETNELTASDVDRDIIRFLNQSTFGATPETYQALRAQISVDGSNRIQIYNQWMDDQISLTPNSMLELTQAVLEHFPEEASSSVKRDAFWNLAFHGKDQLRQRVASTFDTTGNLTAVVKAILLDQEARNPNALKSTTFGKIKEPILQMSAILRLLDAASQISLGSQNDSQSGSQSSGLNLSFSDGFEEQASLLRLGDFNIGQRALGADSVFNFYSPDYTPAGELSSNSLVAPELQLFTESQLYSIINQHYKLVYSGLVRGNSNKFSVNTKAQLTVKLKYDDLKAVWDGTTGSNQDKTAALFDYLDFYLLAGQLKANDNHQIKDIMINAIADLNEADRYKLLIYSVNANPEFIIQK